MKTFEEWAHLGPSGRGLRSSGRRKRGGEEAGKVKGQQKSRGGKEGREGNKQPGLVIQGKVHKKREITDKRIK